MDENVKQDLLKAIAESGHKESDIKCAVLSIHFNYNDSYEMIACYKQMMVNYDKMIAQRDAVIDKLQRELEILRNKE